MPVAAAEIVAGATTAAGSGVIDVAAALASGTGVGVLILAGSLSVTEVGVATAEFGAVTGVGSALYFARDVNDFQSSGSNGASKSNSFIDSPSKIANKTGEVYPKTPNGGIGDSIGNIFDYLPEA